MIQSEDLDFRGDCGHRVNLRFDELRASLWYDKFPDDVTSDRAFQQAQTRFVGLLMAAWSKVRGEPTIKQVLESRSIPFRIINTDEDDVPPLLDVPSLADYGSFQSN